MLKSDRLNGFLFFSLAFLLVLALLPATRWIVRKQFWMAIPGPQLTRVMLEKGVDGPCEWPGREVKPDPSDYLLALGQAETHPVGSKDWVVPEARALRSVDQRFPGRPSMPAHEILNLCQGNIICSRGEDWLLGGGKPPSDFRPSFPDPARVEAVLQAAVRGEQRDPENAFYPLMRACALMGARRDAEAIEALKVAGRKTEWNEYLLEDVDARVHLRERSQGRLSAFSVMVQDSATFGTYHSAIRELARVATYKAILAEQSGHREEGLLIRHALMHVSGLMRADSTDAIGDFVGIAVAQMVLGWPGGVAPVPESANRTENRRRHIETYCSYLASFGHSDEARWVRSQMDAAQQVSHILQRAFSPSPPPAVFPLIWLMGLWVIEAIALCNAVWLLAAAGIANLRWNRRAILPSVCVLSAFLAVIPLWECVRVQMVAQGCSEILGLIVDSPPAFPWFLALAAILSISVPLILSAAILVRTLRRRIPLVRAFREGFRGPGAWLAAACMVIYGLLVIGTAVKEANVLQDRNRMRVNEGRYYAEKFGVTWPGPPDSSPAHKP